MVLFTPVPCNREVGKGVWPQNCTTQRCRVVMQQREQTTQWPVIALDTKFSVQTPVTQSEAHEWLFLREVEGLWQLFCTTTRRWSGSGPPSTSNSKNTFVGDAKRRYGHWGTYREMQDSIQVRTTLQVNRYTTRPSHSERLMNTSKKKCARLLLRPFSLAPV